MPHRLLKTLLVLAACLAFAGLDRVSGSPVTRFLEGSNPVELVILAMLVQGVIAAVLGWRGFLRVRFTSLELLAMVLCHGTILACMRQLLSKLQYGLTSLHPLAVAVGLLIAVGFRQGCANRDRIREDAVRTRWIVFLSGLLFPVALIPAIAVTLVMIRPAHPLRNDWGAATAWLFLVAPVLGQLWFRAIGEAAKRDAPAKPAGGEG
jgi:hypothetical protein